MTCGWSTRPRSSVGAARDGEAVGSGRVGRVRLLRFAFALLLGAAPAPGVHAVGSAGGVRLAGAKADEREVLLGMLDADPNLVAAHPKQKLMADKNYYGKAFEGALADAEVELLRPARKGEKPRPGHRYFKPFRQVIESINNTLKTQLDLERHGGRTIAGVTSRILQRILALTAAIWHNDQLGQPTLRSLTAYDH